MASHNASVRSVCVAGYASLTNGALPKVILLSLAAFTIVVATGIVMIMWALSPLAMTFIVVFCGIGVVGTLISQAWLEAGNGPTTFPATFHKAVKRAEAGDVGAMIELANIYRHGKLQGVGLNLAQAAWWLTRAANNGNPEAAYRLATMIEAGEGTPKDISTAIYWYHMSADAGFGPARHRLSKLE